jgi:HSP20 family molecular chaperone IbpA
MQKLNNKTSFATKKLFKAIYNSGKKIASSKIIFASIFLIIGSLLTYSCQQHQDFKPRKKSYHSHFFHDFDDDFNDDFFTEFDEMHEKMERAFKNHRKIMRQNFAENEKNGDSSKLSKIQASLQHFEDEKAHNFELQFLGIKPEEINVLIEKNYLIFSSKKADIISTKDDDKTTQSSSSADFYYASYLPEYDEKISPEIIKTNEKISVKLLKKLGNKKENSSTKIKKNLVLNKIFTIKK